MRIPNKHLVTFKRESKNQKPLASSYVSSNFLKNYKFPTRVPASRLLDVFCRKKCVLGNTSNSISSLTSRSLLLLSELQWHDGRRRLQCTALCTRCVPYVNYLVHGYILTVGRTQRFQERFIFPLEGKYGRISQLKNLKTTNIILTLSP